MAHITNTHVHERRVLCLLDRHELTRLVKDYAARQAGLDPEAKNLTFKVSFPDASEGSPSNKVGTEAKVEIVEALLGEV